jgi:hypothetical protein
MYGMRSPRPLWQLLPTAALCSLAAACPSWQPFSAGTATGEAPAVIEAIVPSPEQWQKAIGLRIAKDGRSWGLLGFDGEFPGSPPRQARQPFLVHLDQSCVASLVAEQLLVTAAHCLPTGTPSAKLSIAFKDHRGEDIAQTYAVCVLEPAGTWLGQACDTNNAHDRALCYLQDVTKLTMLSRLHLAELADDAALIKFDYAGPTTSGWEGHSGLYSSKSDLSKVCFASGTHACAGWSGTSTFTVSARRKVAGLGLLSKGDQCSPGHTAGTNAVFSSMVDGGMEDLLLDLKGQQGVPQNISFLPPEPIP